MAVDADPAALATPANVISPGAFLVTSLERVSSAVQPDLPSFPACHRALGTICQFPERSGVFGYRVTPDRETANA